MNFDAAVLADINLLPMDVNVANSDGEEEDSDMNALFSVNPVNQGYYVAMYLQRIIARYVSHAPVTRHP